MTARGFAIDAAIVVALVAATSVYGLFAFTAPNAKIVAVVGGSATWQADVNIWWIATAFGMAAMLLRSWRPLVALGGAGAMGVVHTTSQVVPAMPVDLAAAVALYTVAARPSMARVISYAAGAATVALAFLPLVHPPASWLGTWAGSPWLPPVTVALAWLIGDRSRTRQAYLEQVTERARDLERQRHQEAELAAAAERARIARELHDAVAHGLSIVVIQAQAAASTMDRRPAAARAALDAIVATGRDSLGEMRRLLGLTRPDGAELAPLPGLDDLPALVDRVRTTGLPVHVRMSGPLADLPTGIGLSAYRIAQEALTNALKHGGPGTTVEIAVNRGPEAVEIAVADTGRGAGGAPDERCGSGLGGMRERVAMLGGTLEAGDRPGGGFEVRARLPVTDPR
jgi:signal transduction histidine kinase